MTCYHPITVWRSRQRHSKDSWPITFNVKEGYKDLEVQIPCGKCIGCRMEKSRQWAVRIIHESRFHKENQFLTLTYDDEHLPKNNSLNKEDIVLFIKNIRRKLNKKIRYFQCGEYGDLGRPHHHMILFGHEFHDKKDYVKKINKNNPNYIANCDINKLAEAKARPKCEDVSKELSKIWGKGYTYTGDLNFSSAAYVARYVLKKQEKINYPFKIPPYITMSRRPGIGAMFYEKFKSDIYPLDKIILSKDLTSKVPRYYDYLRSKEDKEKMKKLKYHRAYSINREEVTPERLAVKEKLQELKIQKLPRKYERMV